MDMTVLICLILMSGFTAIFIGIILFDVIRIKHNKPSFLWRKYNGITYSIVYEKDGYKMVFERGLPYEEAKRLSQVYCSFAKIERDE